MHTGIAVVRLARRIRRVLCAIAFDRAATDIFQILPLRRRRCRFIEINRNLVTLPDLLTDVAGHGHAIFNGDTVDGNERHDVRCSHTWVRALMFRQVDELGGLANSADSGLLNGLALADQRDDAAVVVGVHFAVEQVHAVHFHGSDDGVNFSRIASLRKIGYAFYERRHKWEEYWSCSRRCNSPETKTARSCTGTIMGVENSDL